jgi:WD40 repeat protein
MNRLKEEIAKRKREVEAETKEVASRHMHGRRLNDGNALRRPETRHAEVRARRAPKRMARMAMYQAEDTNQGLDLDVGEVPDRVAQSDVLEAVDEQTKRKKFDITLDKLGPYRCSFSNNGTDVALCGLRGHLATFKWSNFELAGEIQLKDRCSDVKYIVDNSMLAVAQKRFVYMYTKAGVEMHLLQGMANCDSLEYLPNHMLLCAASSQYSVLHWLDVSTGKNIATKSPAQVKDPTACMARNPASGILATGDVRGVLKMWSPTVEDPVVQLKAHKGAVKDAVYHPEGRFALTIGVDNKVKIWDMRTLRTLEEYGMNYAVDSIDVSAKGIVAIGGGTGIQFWKDLFTTSRPRGPYMKHSIGYGNIVNNVQFCPYEDVLGVGHSKGFSTVLIPGAGDANPDFFRANPFETETHRKGRVVSGLLDKLPAETISMDLQIAGVNEERLQEYNEQLTKQRQRKNVREKKEKKTRAMPTHAVDPQDEVDEELGVREGGVSKLWKPKKELIKERKMEHWQKKDSSDKVRSKQTMRTSRIARQAKMKKATDTIIASMDTDDKPSAGKKAAAPRKERREAFPATAEAAPAIGHDAGAEQPARKAPRAEGDASARKELSSNAALRRFL